MIGCSVISMMTPVRSVSRTARTAGCNSAAGLTFTLSSTPNGHPAAGGERAGQQARF